MKALSHRKQQKGAVLVLVTIALFTLLGFTALALDGGYLILNKNRLQDAVDAAALSGAKTLASTDAAKSTHAEAEKAARDTIRAIMQGDGFQRMKVDTSKLAETVIVEFSDKPVPFDPISTADAKYVRVRMETVPVTQFFSQLMVDVWQVRASAVTGTLAPEKGTKICDVIPLLMLVDANDVGKSGYGYKMASDGEPGDMMVIKSPAAGSPDMSPGHFQALNLGDGNGANKYREALASGNCIEIGEDQEVEECAEGDDSCSLTETEGKAGNMAGPTRQGLNTRFNIYNPGKFKEPLEPPKESQPGDDAYYSDCALTKAEKFDFKDTDLIDLTNDLFVTGSVTKDKLISHLDLKLNDPDVKDKAKNKIPDFKAQINGMQLFSDYNDTNSSTYLSYNDINGKKVGCLDNRRIVKVPVAVGGDSVGKNIPIIGVACMFLNQEVTGNGLSQYIVGELIPECGADGDGADDESGFSQPRLVLYNDTGSGDS